MDADRRSFFFGATLSEIGFILFFALLLFAFYQRQTDSKTIEDVRAEAESLQAEIAARQAALAELEKYIALDSEEERKAFFSELVPRKELANQNNELKRQNAELEKRSRRSQNCRRRLAIYLVITILCGRILRTPSS